MPKTNITNYLAGRYDDILGLSGMQKQSQTNPILSASQDSKLQSVCGYIDDFADEFRVTLLVIGDFGEDVFNILVFNIRRIDNLDVEVSHRQLEVFHHFELAEDFLFIAVFYLGHIA
jgi:hypothetical protein